MDETIINGASPSQADLDRLHHHQQQHRQNNHYGASQQFNSTEQYQYLQHQQLAQQSYASQAHQSVVEPIGIPYHHHQSSSPSSSSSIPNYSGFSSNSHNNPNHLNLPQLQTQQQQFQLQHQRAGGGGSSVSGTSAYFSPTSASKLAPHTNEPSSVSSSYKSVAPFHPYASTFRSSTSYNNSSNSPRSEPAQSLESPSNYYQQQAPPQARHLGSSSSTSPAASTTAGGFFATTSSIGGGGTAPVVPKPGIRMSLLTSKLNETQNSTNKKNTYQSTMTLPHPTETRRGSSSVSYSSDPRLFSTSNGSYTGGGSSFRQQYPFAASASSTGSNNHFLPHASSTTTNLSTSGAAAAAASLSASTSSSHASPMATSPDETATTSSAAASLASVTGSASFTAFPQQIPTHQNTHTAGSSNPPSIPVPSFPPQHQHQPPIPGPALGSSGEPLSQQQQQHHHHYQQQQQQPPVPGPAGPSGQPHRIKGSTGSPHLDISNHPVSDVIVMLTALLNKIIAANDALEPRLDPEEGDNPQAPDMSNKYSANVLSFHGRNVPGIKLHAYLSRILKYCPSTNEVFISLLVYFDRIAQRANEKVGDQQAPPVETPTSASSSSSSSSSPTSSSRSPPLSSSNLATPTMETASSMSSLPATSSPPRSQLFVMDSYNIHRLIIAGVTVSSKFFSDVFYKNSRYAKVGGLPLDELNHLELQFLLLTDFQLMISLEEMQRYADLLLRFWQKEQHNQHHER